MLAPNSAPSSVAGRAFWLRFGTALPLVASLAIGVGLVAASSGTPARFTSPGTANVIAAGPVSTPAIVRDGVTLAPPVSQATGAPGTSTLVPPGATTAPAKAGQTNPPQVVLPTVPPAVGQTVPPATAAPTLAPTFVAPTAAPTVNPTTNPTPTPTPKPTPTPTPKPTPTPTPPPATGSKLVLGAWAGQPWNVSSLNSFSSLIGGAPGMYLTYLSWPDRAQYVASDEKAIANLGVSHVMTWEPFGMTLKSIVNGSHDAYIKQYAQGAAAYGKRFYIRLMHEMNGDWYPWGRGVGGNTPTDFVNAWRHVVDIFNQQGATNVQWVWCPNVRYGSEYPFADLWPGSSYVDWTCLDGYNWGSDPHLGQPAWQSFATIFGSSYNQVMDISTKPMMIGELASTEHGGDKAAWITKTFFTDIPKYSAIKAVVWFNQADGASDFRVNSSSAALAAFKQVNQSSQWSAKLP